MCVHIVGDSNAKLAAIGGLLAEKLPVASQLLGKACLRAPDVHAVVVAADLRDIDNITALKGLARDFSRASPSGSS
jgi:hypothetical protein